MTVTTFLSHKDPWLKDHDPADLLWSVVFSLRFSESLTHWAEERFNRITSMDHARAVRATGALNHLSC